VNNNNEGDDDDNDNDDEDDDDDDDNNNNDNNNNGPDIVLINIENKPPLLIDTAVPLTHNLAKLRQRKLQNMKPWLWAKKKKKSGSLTTHLYTP
jgi:hypothetical protein